VEELLFDVRPEFGADVADEIEPEVEGALQRAEANGVYPVGIPLV
jgi:hypothetical protein